MPKDAVARYRAVARPSSPRVSSRARRAFTCSRTSARKRASSASSTGSRGRLLLALLGERMLREIVRFEWRYHTRQVSFIAAARCSSSSDSRSRPPASGRTTSHINSPYSIAAVDRAAVAARRSSSLAIFCANAVRARPRDADGGDRLHDLRRKAAVSLRPLHRLVPGRVHGVQRRGPGDARRPLHAVARPRPPRRRRIRRITSGRCSSSPCRTCSSPRSRCSRSRP